MNAPTTPFYISDLAALRVKLQRAERDGTRMGQVWTAVRRLARARPESYPWYVPFVALITGDAPDTEAARQAIRNYVSTFDALPFGMGLQFHFWCFSFPHARWSLYFQWLDALGAWDADEARALREQFVLFQFDNFFYGMRTKPEPECVDNQTMSLCFSNALVGHLFSEGPAASATAARMKAEGLRRLPDMLGGMPSSGYSGEGSTYMDYVVGPCIPFLVEYLERVSGGDWFARPLPPHGGSGAGVLQMIAREWMPSGLLLPWDHYGYSLPVRSSIAYAAHRTGDPTYQELLETHASWNHSISIGWGYDDLVWALIWWPDTPSRAPGKKLFGSWANADVGAALVSADTNLYLMQMWDESTPKVPTRAHVNPNALVLSAYGSPLTVDGVVAKDCTAFNYADTWREVNNMSFTVHRYNYGSGCAGSHGVLLVDGWEGMRAQSDYRQADLVSFDEAAGIVDADVTPIYRERWPDAVQVGRRSRLCADRFWLIEDRALFRSAHDVTSRWYLRPALIDSAAGVTIETAEGVRLRLMPLQGPDKKTITTVSGYPDRLDGAALRVDFQQRGTDCRWLWLAWPENMRTLLTALADDWTVAPDPDANFDLPAAQSTLDRTRLRLPFTSPAFMLADQPVVRRWWYRKRLRITARNKLWLRLPRLAFEPALWINGREVDLEPYRLLMNLIEPQVPIPAAAVDTGELDIVVRVDCGVGQYGKENHEGTGFSGQPAILTARDGVEAPVADYRGNEVQVRQGDQQWRVCL